MAKEKKKKKARRQSSVASGKWRLSFFGFFKTKSEPRGISIDDIKDNEDIGSESKLEAFLEPHETAEEEKNEARKRSFGESDSENEMQEFLNSVSEYSDNLKEEDQNSIDWDSVEMNEQNADFFDMDHTMDFSENTSERSSTSKGKTSKNTIKRQNRTKFGH